MTTRVSPAPPASSIAVRERMRAQARKDTVCEMRIRKALYAMGLRYRINRRVLPELRRAADVVFFGASVAVFVDGCFWHGCVTHRSPAKANRGWWRNKLARTADRDRDTNSRLLAAGWSVVRVWEHAKPAVAAKTIAKLVRERGRVSRKSQLCVL